MKAFEGSDTARSSLNAAMDRFADGDRAAFGGVYSALAPRLRKVLHRREPAEADDLVQQAFLRMIEARGSYAKGDVVGWAMTISCRLQIDFRRKHRRFVAFESERCRIASVDDPASRLRADCMERIVRETLLGLPESQRSAWILYRGCGRSIAEIATELGISPNAARIRVHRTTTAIREALDDLERTVEPRSRATTSAQSRASGRTSAQ